MGHVLGLIVKRDFPVTGLVISALVYLDANDAGPGFCTLAIQLGLLAPGGPQACEVWEF
jgi:hypothetical protein